MDNTIDGLVHVSDLVDDFYFFDEKNLRYVGQRTGKVFKMSDRVKVKVSSASKVDKAVDFEIVGMKSNKKTRKTVIINTHRDDKRKHKKSRHQRSRRESRFNHHNQNERRKSKRVKSKYR